MTGHLRGAYSEYQYTEEQCQTLQNNNDAIRTHCSTHGSWLFDFADIAGDVLEAALDAAIDTLLGPLPGWAKDLVRAFFGPIIDLVRAILDLPDDLDEWLSDLFGVSLGLGDLILQILLDYFAREYPINVIEDPFPILPATGGLIPVKVPIEDFTVRVTDDEMIAEANIG
jgi:hypothetical protein